MNPDGGKDGTPGFNPSMFKDLVNPRDPLASIKPFIKAGNVSIVEGMLEKIDVLKFGGDLLTFACKAGKKE